ncbi:protein phosphatase 2C domain-containing protein [Micromonospora sp. NPDC049903]|uniref:protein phosphatase 2C domain-containing protein n=1 Tax=Micromonospora sp. NPDC049903 TaxID=3364276 RepID=UPI0037BA0A98
MEVLLAGEAGAGRTNEDYAIAAPGIAIVLDGVTQLSGLETGCVHDPAWLVRTLGGFLVEALSSDQTSTLDRILAAAIGRLRESHGGGCDLTNPNSPSATVAMVRERGDHVDYLVLCDSSVVIENSDGIIVVRDDRTDRLEAYDRHTVARLRNMAGGFWVASTEPAAAAEAVTGSVTRAGLRRLVLCTDGVSRLTDFFQFGWAEVLELVEQSGPGAVIDAVRRCERTRPDLLMRPGRRPPKQHDDATLIVWRYL